jgi:hypothetical protein
MNELRLKDTLENIARSGAPENIDIWPELEARLNERKSFMQTLRARPLLVLAFALLALLILTTVAYAIGHLTGYIPGIGLIDQSAPIRVLAEPVSQTRDGVTLTVKEAVLTSDKTVLVFSLDGVRGDMLSHNENVTGCSGLATVRLPDGKVLQMMEGGGTASESRFVFTAIPVNVKDATFILPCISDTLAGKAPENWELSLHFIPAPPDLTVVPVIEIQPTSQPTSPAATIPPSPVMLQKVIQIGDRYILMGTLNCKTRTDAWCILTGQKITDAKGKDVFYTMPNEAGLPAFDWGFEINGSTTAFPITLEFTGVYIAQVDPQASAEFEFDAGAYPHPGQEWQVNKDFQIGGHTFRLVSITADSRGGYDFSFHSDEPGLCVNVNIEGYTPVGGGGGGSPTSKDWSVGIAYTEIPTGKLKVILSNLTAVTRSDTWQLQWSPENPTTGTSLYGIALKLDKFIPLDDGYYLLGHTEWSDARITSASPASWALNAYDTKGQEVPLEPADWQAAGLTPETNQWLYKIYGRNFNAPITLRAIQMDVGFKQPVKMTLDLRPYGFEFADNQLGTPWKTGLIPLDVPGILANAFKATYIKQGDLHGFEIAIEADPELQGLGFRIESGLDTSGLSGIAGGGGSNRDEATGLVLSTV